MERQKRYIVIGVVLLALGFAAGCDHYRYHRWHYKNYKFHHGDPEKILERWDSHVEELDLSEDQREKYKGIRQELYAKLTEGKDRREKFFKELKSEVDREKPDVNEMKAKIKRQLKDMEVSIEQGLDLFVDFYNILDEGQQAKVWELVRKRMERKWPCW
jgi:hypothetical protein